MTRHRRQRSRPRSAAPAPPANGRGATGPRPGTWVIQVHALQNRDAANALVRSLTRRAIRRFCWIPSPDPPQIFRVQIGGYSDRREAEQVARRLRRKSNSSRISSGASAPLGSAPGAELSEIRPSGVRAGSRSTPLIIAAARADVARAARSSSGFLAGAVYFWGTLYWLVETMTTFGGLATPVAVFAAAMLVAYLSLFPAAFAVILARCRRRIGPRAALAGALRLGDDGARTAVRLGRLSVGAPRLQPGDASCRSRNRRASSASTVCRGFWR